MADHPERYAEFEASRANARRYVEDNRWVSDEAERTKALNDFDSERQRLNDFMEHFKGEILTFWEWDATLNPDPFKGAKATV